ncbi:ferritin-like domain-containing protein [Pilimelia columellifera]|uniref:Iminophenyl-pyruvate dimer synthase domain-containing protein n=1 Tax=Pilimelia columellifera subsp. columellifera TaxID=706583 RepID=A0ABN3NR26_9ACTN
MSYVGYPRLNFAGTFQADISTVNNVVHYYDNNNFEPRFQRPVYFANNKLIDENGLFNPRGSGAFRLADMHIRSGLRPDGTLLDKPGSDPVVGAVLRQAGHRVDAKMVDIDQRDQTTPGIYGMRLSIVDGTDTELLQADLEPSWIEDLWRRGPGIPLPAGTNASAGFTSVLKNLQWADDLSSPLLRDLRAKTDENLLSIRFVLDGYAVDLVDYGPAHTYGRMVGCIGPYHSGEPRRFVAGRRLRRVSGNSMWDASARVDEKASTVFIDLANSWPTSSKGGPLADLGVVQLAVLKEDGTPEVLAPVPGTDSSFLEGRAGIAAVPLKADQLVDIESRRLALVNSANPPQLLLAEATDGIWVHADETVHRLYPADPYATVTTDVHVTKFGRPAAGVTVTVTAAKPTSTVDFPATLTTDARGRASLRLTAKAPQTEAAIEGVTSALLLGSADRPNQPDSRVAILVFSSHDAPKRPTWNRDVWPIFQQYANLYPVMGGLFDLGNYRHVVEQKTYIKRTLLAPIDSPTHMPVSRDLSPGKRDMIVKWLDTKPVPPILEITSRQELKAVLQQALLLEQATIPLYSAALFSIKPGYNEAIRKLIRGVLLEEMQHMAQVCNILNAIGGTPQIGRPGLVPTYPGKLPGPVLPDVKVRLRRLSLDHVKNVFMAIEQPVHPTVGGQQFRGSVIPKDSVQVDKAGRVQKAEAGAMKDMQNFFTQAEYQPMTIGWYYNQIARAIIKFDDGKLFTGNRDRQVGWPDAPRTLYQVTDRRSALLGILQIIEQGEASPHDLNGDSVGDPEELGHYYRFAEIVNGRQLIRSGNKWVYEGAEIPFDPTGVYPVVDDADSYRLLDGSVGRRESLRCDESYTKMLGALNRVFNGHPEEMDGAVALMGQLQVQAKRLFEIPSAEGADTVLGPAFQSPAPR